MLCVKGCQGRSHCSRYEREHSEGAHEVNIRNWPVLSSRTELCATARSREETPPWDATIYAEFSAKARD